ncbi:MAG: hypothetical protein U9Q76_01005 [candidate division WOR-3 bacterium]|nr:hypothetical protein [candidate division WOR-3 bacterium]
MSWVFSLFVVSVPLFSWADSLYLDPPRLGMIDEFASSGRTSQWVYTDIAVFEQNSASRWVIGLRPVSLSLKPEIDALLESPSIDTVESDDLEELTTYWIGANAYQTQFYKGPWTKIDGILSRLVPSFTVDVKDAPRGAGAQAVHGTLYCGEDFVFRSASGTYEVRAPEAASGVGAYLEVQIERRGITTAEDLGLGGILYLQGNHPLFFYVLEENR